MIDKPAGLGELDTVNAQIQTGIDQAGELHSQIQALSAKIQGETNPSQADMIRLQTLQEKQNEAFELVSSATKKRADATDKIIRNIR